MFAFEKLEVWQKALSLSVTVYKLTEQFPKTEVYALSDQIRRCVASVPANLAEGSARNTSKDQAHFTTIAFSSLMETLNHLILAKELGYIDEDKLNELRILIDEIANKLSALRRSQAAH